MTAAELELVEKIIRAKVILENMKIDHQTHCSLETNPGGYSPCNCGATESNLKIDAVIRELEIKPTS